MDPEPKELTEYKTDHDVLIELRTLVHYMNKKLDEMSGNFVTQAEFWPVKTLVYGCTGLMLTVLVGALLFLVIQH
jgi:hypothetical protein